MWPALFPEDLSLASPLALPPTPAPGESFVYFDIGGVLIDLDWDAFFAAAARLVPGAEKGPLAAGSHTRTQPQDQSPSLATPPLSTPALKAAFADWSRGRTGPWAFARAFLAALGHTEESLGCTGAPGPLEVKEASSLIVGPVRSRSLRLVKRLRAAGVGVGVLSNAVPWHETDIEATLHLRDVFDVVIFSQDVGFEKPEEGIYRAAHDAAARWMATRAAGGRRGAASSVEATARLRQENVFFVDDLPQNVRAARAFGWNASLVCPLEPTLFEEIRSERIPREEGAARAARAENLLFGDAAAARVEDLFVPLLSAFEREV